MNNIVFNKVCKSYGKVEVIRDLDLEIPEGQRLILLGPSGCGKTTIIKELMKCFDCFDFSISATSRAPRGEEVNGRD